MQINVLLRNDPSNLPLADRHCEVLLNCGESWKLSCDREKTLLAQPFLSSSSVHSPREIIEQLSEDCSSSQRLLEKVYEIDIH